MRTRILTVLAVLGLLAGCGASPSGQPSSPSSSSTSGPHGDRLATPVAAPALTLTGTDGRPYDFRAHTAGRVTLLYFGYTPSARRTAATPSATGPRSWPSARTERLGWCSRRAPRRPTTLMI